MKTLILLFITLLFCGGAIITFLMAAAVRSHYLEKIIYLEALIKSSLPNKENFLHIMAEFEDLRWNDRDPPRTQKAYSKFVKKFDMQLLDYFIHEKDETFRSVHKQLLPA
jgi:hypothetical protein